MWRHLFVFKLSTSEPLLPAFDRREEHLHDHYENCPEEEDNQTRDAQVIPTDPRGQKEKQL